MGFFSKVKKLWTSPEKRAEQALKDYLGDEFEEIKNDEPQAEAKVEPEPVPEPEPAPVQEELKTQPEPATAPRIEPAKAEEPQIEAKPEPAPAQEELKTQPEPATAPRIEPAKAEEPQIEAKPEYTAESESVPELEQTEQEESEIPAVEETATEPEISMEAPVEEPEPVSTPEPVEKTVTEPEPESSPEHPVAAMEEKAEPEIPSISIEEPPAAGPTIIEPVMETEAQAESDKPQWQHDLTKSLQQAEPRLSVWLGLILEGIEEAGEELWERLAFLLEALEAPKNEAEDFIRRFQDWLEEMDYEYVEEFRSELQYRLALALELEDEEDERSRLFIKLSEGLNKTREQITKRIDSMLSSHTAFDDDFWEEFEEILIMADVGFDATMELVERMKDRVRKAGETNPENFKDLLREELDEIFKVPRRIKAYNPPEVVMMIGVNGVGKTTTIAKLAHRAQMQGRKVLIVAGDTFRAAAIGQLEVWARRVGAGFYAKEEGSDPAAVAYEAIDYAVKNGYDLMLLDTAGRLHTKTNLMEELHKIRRVLGKKHDEAPHRSVLVIDATTGQNALSQTKLFNEAIGVDELILTKLDGTAKGGVMIAVTMQNKLPITYVGLGEKMEDLRPFNGEDFAKALLLS